MNMAAAQNFSVEYLKSIKIIVFFAAAPLSFFSTSRPWYLVCLFSSDVKYNQQCATKVSCNLGTYGRFNGATVQCLLYTLSIVRTLISGTTVGNVVPT